MLLTGRRRRATACMQALDTDIGETNMRLNEAYSERRILENDVKDLVQQMQYLESSLQETREMEWNTREMESNPRNSREMEWNTRDSREMEWNTWDSREMEWNTRNARDAEWNSANERDTIDMEWDARNYP